MYLLHIRTPVTGTFARRHGRGETPPAPAEVDISHPQVGRRPTAAAPAQVTRRCLPAPADPQALPRDRPRPLVRPWNSPVAEWRSVKPCPASPGDGPHGKKVIYLEAPSTTPTRPQWSPACRRWPTPTGSNSASRPPTADINIQSQQVDQVITQQPDMVIIEPGRLPGLRPALPPPQRSRNPGHRHQPAARPGRPQITSSPGPAPTTGAKCACSPAKFASNNEQPGRLCHHPAPPRILGLLLPAPTARSPNSTRSLPDMKVLAVQTTDLESEKTKEVVSGWITRFGDGIERRLLRR